MLNLDSALGQMQSLGLLLDHIEPDGRVHRCKVEGERERRGWYLCHTWRASNGNEYVVGSFGVWHGNDAGVRKIELGQIYTVTPEEREALKQRLAADRKRAKAQRELEAERASNRAAHVWAQALTEPPPGGLADYLTRKGVQAYGLRYSPSGALIIPLQDGGGVTWGLQFILPSSHERRKKTGRDKEYWPAGMAKQGRWHQIGSVAAAGITLIAEGYATAATLHEATGLPVAVAFDAGNLLTVAQAIRKAYRSARILLCADDDYLTDGNPGCSAAAAAALAIKGEWLKPEFPVDRAGRKLTDFNDLQHAPEGGLHLVRSQVDAKLLAVGWRGTSARDSRPQGGGEYDSLMKPLLSVDEACGRFSLIYGAGGTLFDHEEHALIPKADVLDICVDHAWKDWKPRPDRRVVRLRNVGFDPGERDPEIICNLWGGWPTVPKAGGCELLLQLLRYLCSVEHNGQEVYGWALKWIAYPIQNPGAKMKTAMIFHGPQGTGKNLFFEAVAAIYGIYGRVVDQAAIEDKFNDWASRKLFLIADEVVARQELFHTKNKLKALITGDWIRINPKNVAAHEERNHVNLVFMSNERQPLVLEPWDRRYTVVWTPDKLDPDFYRAVGAEIEAGGVAALHDYLLRLPMGDFGPHAKPIYTQAKQDLIDVSLDSVERFLRDWQASELPLPFCPCAGMDLYAGYLKWGRINGVQRPRESSQLLAHVGKLPGWANGLRRIYENTNYIGATTPKRILMPPMPLLEAVGTDIGQEKTEAQWLTDCFFGFRRALEDYR